MVLTAIEGLIPYGAFEVKFNKKKRLFVVVKNSQIVFKSKLKGKAIKKAINLSKKFKKRR